MHGCRRHFANAGESGLGKLYDVDLSELLESFQF